MSIKKKLGIAIIAIIVLLTVGSIFKFSSDSSKGSKNIELLVVSKDEGVENFEKSFKIASDAETLEALLKENDDLKVVIEESTYGAFMNEMLGLKNGGDAGPWWVYESENNKDCVDQGMCPAMSEVHIQDKDVFTFKYTSEMF